MIPKDKYVAVIGCGFWGSKHISEYQNLGISVVAVDENRDTLEKMSEKGIISFPSLNNLLESDIDIFGASICTPNKSHSEVAKKLMEKGIPVLVEKPLSTSVEEAEKTVKYAKDNNIKLVVGHIFRFNNAIRKVKQIIEAGEIGDIRLVKFQWTNIERLFDDRDVILDLALHPFDILDYIIDGDINIVSSTGASYRETIYPEVAFLSGFYGDIIFQIEVSWLTPPKVRELTVVGSKASLIVDAVGQKINMVNNSGEITKLNVVENNTIRDELQGFVNYILDSDYEHPARGKVGNRIVKIVSEALDKCQTN